MGSPVAALCEQIGLIDFSNATACKLTLRPGELAGGEEAPVAFVLASKLTLLPGKPVGGEEGRRLCCATRPHPNDRYSPIQDPIQRPLLSGTAATLWVRRPSGLAPLDGKFGGEIWPTFTLVQLPCGLVRQEAKFEGEGSRDRLGGKL